MSGAATEAITKTANRSAEATASAAARPRRAARAMARRSIARSAPRVSAQAPDEHVVARRSPAPSASARAGPALRPGLLAADRPGARAARGCRAARRDSPARPPRPRPGAAAADRRPGPGVELVLADRSRRRRPRSGRRPTRTRRSNRASPGRRQRTPGKGQLPAEAAGRPADASAAPPRLRLLRLAAGQFDRPVEALRRLLEHGQRRAMILPPVVVLLDGRVGGRAGRLGGHAQPQRDGTRCRDELSIGDGHGMNHLQFGLPGRDHRAAAR